MAAQNRVAVDIGAAVGTVVAAEGIADAVVAAGDIAAAAGIAGTGTKALEPEA